MRRIAIHLSVVFGLACGVLCPLHTAEAQKIQVGLEFINSRASALWLAQEQGFFAKEGVEAEVVPIRGGTAGAQAITSGQIQLSFSATAAAIPAIAAGADIVELMNFEPVVAYLFLTSKEIKAPGELRGKRIGVSGLGLSNSSLAARIALKQFGLDPARDRIAFTAMGSETERVLAIVSGTVAATVLGPEFGTKAEQAGIRVLADLRTLGIPWAGSNLATTRRYLQANRESVDRFLRAILRTIAFIRDPENKPAVLHVFREKLKLEEGALDQTYRDLLTYYFAKKPYPKLASIRFMIREASAFFPQVGKLRPEEVATLEPLRALDQSGWIDGLYRTAGK